MRVSVIAAVDRNGLIGGERGLPWHLPRDLRRFRELTWGKPIIMGRTTHEHIGRPLPGRHNLVLSRRTHATIPGCTLVSSIDQAIQTAAKESEEVFVIGGGEVYREVLPRADRLYLTVVDGVFVGTTFFPGELLRQGEWVVKSREVWEADAKNDYRHVFLVLERNLPHDSPADRFEYAALLAEMPASGFSAK
jgi:dihydrofolate reductase